MVKMRISDLPDFAKSAHQSDRRLSGLRATDRQADGSMLTLLGHVADHASVQENMARFGFCRVLLRYAESNETGVEHISYFVI